MEAKRHRFEAKRHRLEVNHSRFEAKRHLLEVNHSRFEAKRPLLEVKRPRLEAKRPRLEAKRRRLEANGRQFIALEQGNEVLLAQEKQGKGKNGRRSGLFNYLSIFVFMKRAISIALLFVLPLTAVQPTLAFHFCGGSLHAVGIGYAGSNCCTGGMDAGQSDGSRQGGAAVFSEAALPCCSDHTIEISTDTYRAPSVLPAAPGACPADSFLKPCLPASLAGGYEPPALSLQSVFPPGERLFYTTGLLTLICILRI